MLYDSYTDIKNTSILSEITADTFPCCENKKILYNFSQNTQKMSRQDETIEKRRQTPAHPPGTATLPLFESRKSNTLVVCDFFTRIKKVYSLPFGFDYTSDVIQVRGMIYISGGGVHNDLAHKNVIAYDLAKMTGIRKGSMVHGKFCHNTANLCDKHIYSVGGKARSGENNETCIAVTEKYNITKDVWSDLPKLNERKHCVGVAVVNSRYLYCFGGWYDDGMSGSIEFFDTLDETQPWTVVRYKSPAESPARYGKRTGVGCVQCNPSGILVFGGTFDNELKECFQFQTEDATMNEAEPLQRHGGFYCTKVVVAGHKARSVDYSIGAIHEYDFRKKQWGYCEKAIFTCPEKEIECE